MKKLMKVKEVAEQLGVVEKTVYRLIWNGDLKAKKVGRAMRISAEDLEEYLNQQDVKVA
ncbi:helix-turn-helix domain-containing protein [Pontiellaceae bacterium B12227]|nr:helix-turn-helix domain-containing protein [Pontiellaceae bacterium B12227]